MTRVQKVIKARVGFLKLAEKLGNVYFARKVYGIFSGFIQTRCNFINSILN